MGYRTSERFEIVKNNIIEILQCMQGDKEDIAYMIYEQIFSLGEEGSEGLSFFLKESEKIESNGEKRVEKVFSEEEKYQYPEQYGKIVNSALEIILKKNLDENQFYIELWKLISENPIFENIKLKAFALYYIWIDIRIPYYEIEDGIRMGNDEYTTYTKLLLEKIRKARFILNVPTEQKTERASRLISLINEVESEKEKVVLLAHILELSDKSKLLIAKLTKDGVLKKEKE